MVDKLQSGWDLKERFQAWNRDYSSLTGYEALLEFYDDIDENMELDVVGICCDWDEYGDNACELTIADLINDKGYIYPVEEYMSDNYLEENEFDRDCYIEALVEKIAEQTTVIELSNGNYLIACF